MIAVIMPIYNTEQYLRAAIDSIVNQTLPFRENVRLLLLDDASTDGSLAICQEYREAYPENIILKHFDQNQGVSALRNYGVEQCRQWGDDVVVSFIDSDDRIGEDVFERVTAYFDEHPDIHVATVEIRVFDAVEKEHKTNWRFRDREVVDIRKDYTYPHYYIGGTFLRGSAFRRIHFNEKMNFWEDALAINQVILDEGRYGLLPGAYYYYRRRADESSLVDVAWRSKERYTTFLKEGYGSLMRYSRRKKLRVIPYVQFLIVYHMRQFMFKDRQDMIQNLLTEQELDDFCHALHKILKKISVDIILQMPTTLPIIDMMLSIRADRPVRADRVYTDSDCLFMYNRKLMAKMSERRVNLYPKIDRPDSPFHGMWKATFYTPIYAMKPDDGLFVEYHGQRIEAKEYRSRKNMYILGRRVRCYYHARFAIDLPDDWDRVKFYIHVAERDVDIALNEIVREDWKYEEEPAD